MSLLSIAAVNDPRLAYYQALPSQNLTAASGRFIAEGDKVVERLIQSRYAVESILAEESKAAYYASLVPPEVPVFQAPRPLLESVIGFNFHRGALACGRREPKPTLESVLPSSGQPALWVVAEGIHDPSNLGTILRTAAAFGANGVVLGGSCADPFARRVLRVSMGWALHLPIYESADLARDLALLQRQGFHTIATVLDESALPLAQCVAARRIALVLGNEAHGLSTAVQAVCNQRVTIPMQVGIDSLNVGLAAAICLYHFRSSSG